MQRASPFLAVDRGRGVSVRRLCLLWPYICVLSWLLCTVHCFDRRWSFVHVFTLGLPAFRHFLFLVSQNYAEMEFGWLRLTVLIVFGITDFTVAVYERYSRGGSQPISYSAHLAGAFVGLTLGMVGLRNLIVTKCERVLRWISFFFCLTFFIIAVGVNLLATNYYPVPHYD